MNKEDLDNIHIFEGLTASEVWIKLYNKELNSKKNILEYIEIVRQQKKESLSQEQLRDTYNYIYDQIEGMKDTIKPNTMLFLKNNLKAQLGKFVKVKDPKPLNHFMEFFKEAYPENYRKNDYTWVLMDIKKITEDQIWTTLTYINRETLSNQLVLSADQKKDIIEVIELGVAKKNLKFINNVRSLKTLTDKLDICITNVDQQIKVSRK